MLKAHELRNGEIRMSRQTVFFPVQYADYPIVIEVFEHPCDCAVCQEIRESLYAFPEEPDL